MKGFFKYRGMAMPPTLIAGVIFGFLALVGVYSLTPPAPTGMNIVTSTSTVTLDQTLTAHITVFSDVSVNVFAGVLEFDPSIAVVERIDYNTSIANLWTEEPWYHNGDGTISFAGGTTATGGFVGSGVLITVTFRAIASGRQNLHLRDTRILEHDGFGSETEVASHDVFFTVTQMADTLPAQTTTVTILPPAERFDLTGDGKVALADLSVFFSYLFRNDLRGDFNGDGRVSTADLSMLLTQMRTD